MNTNWVIIIVFFISWYLFIIGFIMSKDVAILADTSVYSSAAHGLIEFGGFVDVYLPNNPPHIMYPPLFSIMWAFILFLFPSIELLAIRMLIILFGGGVLVVCWFLLSNFNKLIRILILICMSFNYCFIHYSINDPLSDTPYMFFSLLSLLLLRNKKNSIKLIGVIFINLSIFTRTIGVALIAELFLLGFFILSCKKETNRSNVKFFLASSIILLFSISLLTYNSIINADKNTFPTHQGYLVSYKDAFIYGEVLQLDTSMSLNKVIERYKTNSFKLISTIPELIFYQYHNLLNKFLQYFHITFLKKSISILISLFIILGLLINIKKDFTGPAYVLLYILILFNFEILERYLMVLLPLFFYFFIAGIIGFLGRNGKIIVAILLLISILTNVVGLIKLSEKKNQDLDQNIISYINSSKWLKEYVKDNDLIMSRYPAGFYFYSGIKGIGFPLSYNQTWITKTIIKYNITFIVIDNISSYTEIFLKPYIFSHEKNFREVYNDNITKIYKVTNISKM